jgi:hypothetical protein
VGTALRETEGRMLLAAKLKRLFPWLIFDPSGGHVEWVSGKFVSGRKEPPGSEYKTTLKLDGEFNAEELLALVEWMDS